MKTSARQVATGGIFAALALVIMNLGSLIPVNTYVCPMLCMLLEEVVRRICGRRIAWGWYGTVSVLCLLMAPDKEAAAVFLFLGYYPIVKPTLEKLPFPWLWKLLLFNASVIVLYWLLMHLFGMSELSEDFKELGAITVPILLILGNLSFILLDLVLTRFADKWKKRR